MIGRVMKLTRIRALVLIFYAAFGCGTPSVSKAADCAEILKNPPQPLFETGVIYKYIVNLDRANCPKLHKPEFDRFIQELDLNLVSYVLLEARLSRGGMETGKEAIAAYLRQYGDTKTKMDDNAVLPLIDIAYYSCKGDQICIGKTVQSLVDVTSLTKPAACLYGLPNTCVATDLRPNFYFVNDATLVTLPAAKNALKLRARFICERYQNCDPSDQTSHGNNRND
ncbi:hypothetical protein ACQZ4Q_05010 [Agrobacterium vitis]|uniref:hypothetical protein n=1 Tax=Agrobacterium vitis TaxID=373 RepID=UPI003D292675